MIGLGKPFGKGESQLRRTYQINKKGAVQNFGRLAGPPKEQIQFALPLPEVLTLVQQGLMQLALTAFNSDCREDAAVGSG